MKLQWPFRYVGMTRRDARSVDDHIAVDGSDPERLARDLAPLIHRELLRQKRRTGGLGLS